MQQQTPAGNHSGVRAMVGLSRPPWPPLRRDPGLSLSYFQLRRISSTLRACPMCNSRIHSCSNGTRRRIASSLPQRKIREPAAYCGSMLCGSASKSKVATCFIASGPLITAKPCADTTGSMEQSHHSETSTCSCAEGLTAQTKQANQQTCAWTGTTTPPPASSELTPFILGCGRAFWIAPSRAARVYQLRRHSWKKVGIV